MARRPLPLDRLHSEPVLLKLTPPDFERLAHLAGRRDMPIAVLGRALLIQALEACERQQDAADRAA